jgi:hypothetical protein
MNSQKYKIYVKDQIIEIEPKIVRIDGIEIAAASMNNFIIIGIISGVVLLIILVREILFKNLKLFFILVT